MKKFPSNLSQLITFMVDMKPERRRPAWDLYERALPLLGTFESEQEDGEEDGEGDEKEHEEEERGSRSPTQAAYPEQYNLLPSGGLQTMCFQPALTASPEAQVTRESPRLRCSSALAPRLQSSLLESKGKKRAATSALLSSSSSGRWSRHTRHHRRRQQQRRGPAEEHVSELFDPLSPLGGGSTLAEAFTEANSDWVDPQSALKSQRSGPWSAGDLHLPASSDLVPRSLALPLGDRDVLHDRVLGGGADPVEDHAGWFGGDEFTAANLLLALRDTE